MSEIIFSVRYLKEGIVYEKPFNTIEDAEVFSDKIKAELHMNPMILEYERNK